MFANDTLKDRVALITRASKGIGLAAQPARALPKPRNRLRFQ